MTATAHAKKVRSACIHGGIRDDPSGDKGFTVWGKPATETMAEWYGRR